MQFFNNAAYFHYKQAYSDIPSTSSGYSSQSIIRNHSCSANDDEENSENDENYIDDDHDDDDDDDSVDPVHLKFNFNFHRGNRDLPIMSSKANILKAIKKNTIVIVQGATGCGKTTQVRQFLSRFNLLLH